MKKTKKSYIFKNEEGREALIEQLAIDMASTIGGWPENKIKDIIKYDQFWSYANDWYSSYQLENEEVDELARQVKDFFAEEEEEEEEEEEKEAERDHLDDLDSLDRAGELSPLARLRIKAGMTQGELAEAAGVHINIIGRLERGERSPENMQLMTAIKLAEILGCRPEDLIQ